MPLYLFLTQTSPLNILSPEEHVIKPPTPAASVPALQQEGGAESSLPFNHFPGMPGTMRKTWRHRPQPPSQGNHRGSEEHHPFCSPKVVLCEITRVLRDNSPSADLKVVLCEGTTSQGFTTPGTPPVFYYSRNCDQSGRLVELGKFGVFGFQLSLSTQTLRPR